MEKLIAFGFKIFSKNKAILLPCRGCIVKKKKKKVSYLSLWELAVSQYLQAKNNNIGATGLIS